ncbi:transforming acidic coiled-coil-containing protein 1 isoform X1 [Oncorhynchus tshawytscha]|uniref:Transforming acidic coiled-coil-containing protein C-terminal domain-containing protein n=1 Tax=Oncorhynchus tshawytscha TaxID=74940 RepID=A0AAZ3SW91_ONCTS|nr:transforming acidic coiled-coil-containing protein 1 isoform X1 [Oncorhynchus tshawytscha]
MDLVSCAGGEEDEGEEGAPGTNDGENSDSEGNFETPEAESPGLLNDLTQLDNSAHTVLTRDVGQLTPRLVLDRNSNQDVYPTSLQEVQDALNNLNSSSPSLSGAGLDQNLNLRLISRPGEGDGLSPSPLPQPRTLRPASLPVHNFPDPAEVDDISPINYDPNGNMNSDPKSLTPELDRPDSDRQSPKMSMDITNSCKVKKLDNQTPLQNTSGEDNDHRKGHATDEEKLASTTGLGADGDHNELNVSARPEESDCCSMYEDTCQLKNAKLGGSNTQKKTGSEILDAICISEEEKMAVLTLIREEIITKETEASDWRRKYEDSRQEVMEMRKIVAEYEKTIAQMIEDEQRNTLSAQKSLQAVTMEKELALADLNSVERSLSDMFRRYENMKSTLDGFKKNEEVLKKCAQEYLARVKQEEQRYQTLKLHAEEKLDKANQDIAQVRSKASSESVALTASLRKEQMRVDSLERALQQKAEEIEELTKICDELIAKMGRTD